MKSDNPTPFYHLVPKGYKENLLYRRKMWRAASKDVQLQKRLWTACSRDILYWINTFCRIFEPRKMAILPWITYDFQDEVMLDLQRAVRDGVDVAVAKSRDMGLSWMTVALADHYWLFSKWSRMMFTSRTEDLVDKKNDSDALMWKSEFLVNNLPKWMRPQLRQFDRTSLHYENPERNSVIDGASTTETMGTGGRRLFFVMDEFAKFTLTQGYGAMVSTQANTDCRIIVSTPYGAYGAFYDRFHDPNLNTRRIKVHWSRHPRKRPGLYTSDRGRLKVLDKDYKFPDDYPFVLDGRLRSPWYDKEWYREPNKQMVAQELDIDFVGSGNPFFSPQRIAALQAQYGCPPLCRATLVQDSETFRPKSFELNDTGPFHLWQPMLPDGKPMPTRTYCIGVDIALGGGASNSCVSIGDAQTREKIGSFASPYIRPEGMAEMVYGLATWFNNAKVIWESNPVCRPFGDRLVELGYGNIFMRQTEDLNKKTTAKAGWHATAGSKESAMSELRRAIEGEEFIQHDVEAFHEYTRYIIGKNGKLEFIGGSMGVDKSGAEANHGDRVIADMLLWHLLKDFTAKEREIPREIPPNSFAGRRLRWERSQRNAKYAWWSRAR